MTTTGRNLISALISCRVALAQDQIHRTTREPKYNSLQQPQNHIGALVTTWTNKRCMN